MIFLRLHMSWVLLGFLLPYAIAQAQLPAPSRTVYKCKVNGIVSYSDEPCLGAERLDVVPTRGADRLSGSTRTGQDVAREIRSEQFAHAFRPVTGMSASQFATASRRFQLDAASQNECGKLEAAILTLEQAERAAGIGIREPIRQDLYAMRKRYKTLRC